MKTMILTVALGAGLIAMPALSQAPGGGGWAQRDQTRAEAQKRADTMFQMLDSNHDGTLTKAEADDALTKFEAVQTADTENRGAGRVKMLQRLVERLFATTSSIAQQQFEALMLTRFDAMDLNHDGIVTAAERDQYRAQRAGTCKASTVQGRLC